MALDELTGMSPPALIRPERENISQFLRGLDQWIVWKGEWKAEKNKYSKIPVHPVKEYKIDPLDPKNHMTFEEAWKAFASGVGSGVGFVMTGASVGTTENGDPLYLVALDLDKVIECEADTAFARGIFKRLGSYMEISPSGEGLRFLFSQLTNHAAGKRISAKSTLKSISLR